MVGVTFSVAWAHEKFPRVVYIGGVQGGQDDEADDLSRLSVGHGYHLCSCAVVVPDRNASGPRLHSTVARVTWVTAYGRTQSHPTIAVPCSSLPFLASVHVQHRSILFQSHLMPR